MISLDAQCHPIDGLLITEGKAYLDIRDILGHCPNPVIKLTAFIVGRKNLIGLLI
jgi:hypothetical protein